MEIKIYEIQIAHDGTFISVPNIALKQYENNSIFRIVTDALLNSDYGVIALNFNMANGEDYPMQYATYVSDGVYEWRLQQDLTLEAPDNVNVITLNIMAKNYDDDIFSTVPLNISLTQTNANNKMEYSANSVESLSNDINATNKRLGSLEVEATDLDTKVEEYKKEIDANTLQIATNKENIEINKENIATNKANITTNTTNIALNEVKITNLENTKANASDVYTKTDVYNKSETYSQNEVDTQVATKSRIVRRFL